MSHLLIRLWPYAVVLPVAFYLGNKHKLWIVDQAKNIRRHKFLFALLALSLFGCYKLFVINYTLVNPIVKRGGETYTDIWNERASLLKDLRDIKDANAAGNAQALKDIENNR